MATDPYQTFQTTFRRAKADGFTDAVATAIAQEAMADGLRQAAVPHAPTQVITQAPAGRKADPGPVLPASRGDLLGLRSK